MYSSLLSVHRWLGITVGLFFVLLGLSGSYITYKDTFQSWVAADVRRSSDTQGEVNIAKSALVAQESLGLSVPPSGIKWSENPQRNLEFLFSGIPGMGKTRITAFVDPVTSEFKGRETFRETFSGRIFYFHHDIFLGGVGRTILAVAGIAMLLLLLGGLYLWWPRKQSWWRVLKLGPMNNSVQTNLELHKLFGFYTILLMLLVTFSGVYISKPGWFQKTNSSKQEEEQAVSEVDFAALGDFLKTQEKPLSAQIDAKKSTLQLQIHDGPKTTFQLNDFQPKDELQKGNDTKTLMRGLHGGQFWSSLGKILIFISGLLPLFFYISGVYVWWKKSIKRRST